MEASIAATFLFLCGAIRRFVQHRADQRNLAGDGGPDKSGDCGCTPRREPSTPLEIDLRLAAAQVIERAQTR